MHQTEQALATLTAVCGQIPDAALRRAAMIAALDLQDVWRATAGELLTKFGSRLDDASLELDAATEALRINRYAAVEEIPADTDAENDDEGDENAD